MVFGRAPMPRATCEDTLHRNAPYSYSALFVFTLRHFLDHEARREQVDTCVGASPAVQAPENFNHVPSPNTFPHVKYKHQWELSLPEPNSALYASFTLHSQSHVYSFTFLLALCHRWTSCQPQHTPTEKSKGFETATANNDQTSPRTRNDAETHHA